MTTTEMPCSCGHDSNEPTGSQGVSRRTVVRAAVAAGALGAVHAGATSTRYAFASAGPAVSEVLPSAASQPVLLVISLRGGFDGLSAVVPAGDPAYAAARPTLAVPTSKLLPLDSMFGLHPALAPLKPFWDAGTFAVAHAIGQSAPSRSHFSAMSELERAAPGSTLRTGWLDRLLAAIPGTSTFKAAQLGGGALSQALSGPQPELVMQSIKEFSLSAAWDATERERWITALSSMNWGAPAPVAFPASVAAGALAKTTAMNATTYVPSNGAVYPDTEFGEAMQDVARLVKAKLGLRVACIDYGDWDFHQNMGNPDTGDYALHLNELAKGMAALATDLGWSGMRSVTMVTLSEFGRRVAENGSGGTDHGHGNAVMMLGGGVKGGAVYGQWPGLAPSALADGDLAVTTDYRQLLAEIVSKRFGAASSNVFPDLVGNPLGAFLGA